ncbi:MAG: adenylyltransferase/cytidyltransferase family protein [Gemmatimonadetes bacterium]|nr:adenylyltransferase/cytidyltransferase family protein [Gemmatimonadota bacterium]
MIRVYADMVADLFHHGHVLFLQRARALGDRLVVGIHADDVVMSYKRRPILTMDERVMAVRGCRYVDEVIPDAPLVVDRAWIELHRIDFVVHADDLDEDELDRLYRAPREMGIFRTVPYTHGISTTEIIERIKRSDASAR